MRDAHVTGTANRDTGVPPVPATPESERLHIRQGAYLPHWTMNGSVYAVTFRLADSLPQQVLKTWIAERDAKKPLFLYVPFNAVHGPYQTPPEYEEPYGSLPK